MTAALRLTETRIRAGVWEALLSAPGAGAPPALEVMHRDRAVAGLAAEPVPGAAGVFALRLPIPPEAVSDGVETLLIRVAGSGETLGHVAILAGATLDADLRAEVDLLRAELDLLKRAFRRHCVDTGAA